MMYYASGLRLRHPVGPPSTSDGGGFPFGGTSSIVINRCSAAGRITTSNKHNHALMTFAAADEKSPVDLSPDLHHYLLSRQHKVDLLLDSVKWDDKGLAMAIVQNVDTGAILMQGFVNRNALALTISSRKASFYSRSRSKLWTKGETSSNFINVCDIFLDCDRDSIIYLGKPDGPACHTGSETCYFSSVSQELEPSSQQVEENELAASTLFSLESTISMRKSELVLSESGKPSWTKKLLLSSDLLCKKIREEADELCRTLEDDKDKSRTASEMADVLYHSMVLLSVRDVKMEDVLEILRQRFSQSGIEEKESRTTN